MKILIWVLLFGAVVCELSNETTESTDVIKLVEKYVLAADFDNNPVAQVPVSQDVRAEPKNGNQISFPNGQRNPQVYFPRPPDLATASGDSVDRDAFAPADPTLLISQRSVLAVGFLTFLILLNSLQSSMMNMAILRNPAPASTSLLGGVTQALGRRRRRRTIK